MSSTPVQSLLERLGRVQATGNGWKACCPAHDDHNPSLSINEGDDGRALLKCFAGCTVEEVCDAVGLRVVDLMPDQHPSTSTKSQSDTQNEFRRRRQKHNQVFETAKEASAKLEQCHGPVSNTWQYENSDGEIVGYILRWDLGDGKKDIRPISKNDEGWVVGAIPVPRPLYRLSHLRDFNDIYVVEGEKAADAAASIGLTATTSSGGCKAASKTDWSPLAGKNVIIVPDNDDPGLAYAEDAAAILTKLHPPASVRILEIPDLEENGDIADWLDDHDAVEAETLRDEIERMASDSEPFQFDQQPTIQPFRPFPTEELPSPVKEFVQAAAQSIGCDDSYIALPLLTVIAGAIGVTRVLEVSPDYLVKAIIWSMIVGESGSAKSPALKSVKRFPAERQKLASDKYLLEFEDFQLKQQFYEKDLKQWQKTKQTSDDPPRKPSEPQMERCLIGDTTTEALASVLKENLRGVTHIEDEMAGWAGSFDRYSNGNSDASRWLSLFDGDGFIIDRKTGIPKLILVKHGAVSITGGIQPTVLERCFNKGLRESGMLARFLLTMPPPRAVMWSESSIDPGLALSIEQLLNGLYELQPVSIEGEDITPMRVKLAPAAKFAWTETHNRLEIERAESCGERASFLAKLKGYVGKFALVVHCVRHTAGDRSLIDVDECDLESMQISIRLTEWFQYELDRIYAWLDANSGVRQMQSLTDWIERKGGKLSVREVQQGHRRFKTAEDAKNALQELVDAGLGVWVMNTKRPGRPSELFELLATSAVYKTTSEASQQQDGSFVDVDSNQADFSDDDWEEV